MNTCKPVSQVVCNCNSYKWKCTNYNMLQQDFQSGRNLLQHPKQIQGLVQNFQGLVIFKALKLPFTHWQQNWRKANDILTSTLATILFSSHPKRERDRQAHSNYYASAYNRKRQLSHRKTKLNQIQQNTRINLNQVIQKHKINTTN